MKKLYYRLSKESSLVKAFNVYGPLTQRESCAWWTTNKSGWAFLHRDTGLMVVVWCSRDRCHCSIFSFSLYDFKTILNVVIRPHWKPEVRVMFHTLTYYIVLALVVANKFVWLTLRGLENWNYMNFDQDKHAKGISVVYSFYPCMWEKICYLTTLR